MPCLNPTKDADVAGTRKTDAISHAFVRALPVATAPAFFTRLRHDDFGVSDIL